MWFLILVTAQTGLLVVAALFSSTPLLDTLLNYYEPALRQLDAALPAEVPRLGNTVLGFVLLILSVHIYALLGAIITSTLTFAFRRAR